MNRVSATECCFSDNTYTIPPNLVDSSLANIVNLSDIIQPKRAFVTHYIHKYTTCILFIARKTHFFYTKYWSYVDMELFFLSPPFSRLPPLLPLFIIEKKIFCLVASSRPLGQVGSIRQMRPGSAFRTMGDFTFWISLSLSPKFGLSPNKKSTSLFGLTFAHSEFWTERKTNPNSEVTRCFTSYFRKHTPIIIGHVFVCYHLDCSYSNGKD